MTVVVSEGLRNQMTEAARERTPRVKAQLTRMYTKHSRKALDRTGINLPRTALKERVGRAVSNILK